MHRLRASLSDPTQIQPCQATKSAQTSRLVTQSVTHTRLLPLTRCQPLRTPKATNNNTAKRNVCALPSGSGCACRRSWGVTCIASRASPHSLSSLATTTVPRPRSSARALAVSPTLSLSCVSHMHLHELLFPSLSLFPQLSFSRVLLAVRACKFARQSRATARVHSSREPSHSFQIRSRRHP